MSCTVYLCSLFILCRIVCISQSPTRIWSLPPDPTGNHWLFSMKSEGCLVVSDSLGLHAVFIPWTFPSQNTGVGRCSPLQGCQGVFDGRIPTRCLSWVLCPSSSRAAHCSQGLRPLCEAGLGLLWQTFSLQQKCLVSLPFLEIWIVSWPCDYYYPLFPW